MTREANNAPNKPSCASERYRFLHVSGPIVHDEGMNFAALFRFLIDAQHVVRHFHRIGRT